MVARISLDRAYLAAIWLETLLYGMNTVLFCSYLFVLRYKSRAPHANCILLAAATMMFMFSTVHVSLGFSRLIEGFIVLRDAPGGPAAYFSDVSVPLNVAKVCIHTVNSVIGDSIVVWRCWHVWGRNLWACAVPAILIIGSAVCGFAQTIIFANAKDIHSAFATTLEHWNGSLFSLSLATNVIVTILVAGRILYLEHRLYAVYLERRQRSHKYRRVLMLIIESAAIYSAALVCEITLYFLNTNAFYIVYDPIAQLTGIVPTMIIVLSSLGMTSSDFDSALASTKVATTSYDERHSRPTYAESSQVIIDSVVDVMPIDLSVDSRDSPARSLSRDKPSLTSFPLDFEEKAPKGPHSFRVSSSGTTVEHHGHFPETGPA